MTEITISFGYFDLLKFWAIATVVACLIAAAVAISTPHKIDPK